MTERQRSTALPPISGGSPRQVSWASDIRERYVRARWGGRGTGAADDATRAVLARLTSARWWIDNRDRIDAALAERNPLPAMTGGTEQARRAATRIRAELVGKRWGNAIPPGVLDALRRLTDAEWWVRNAVGDGRPQAIDRAVGAEVPEHDRRQMALPTYGPPKPAHTGRCEDQPAYAAAFAKALNAASRSGDSRSLQWDDGPRLPGASCCLSLGSTLGGREGKRRWLENRAAEIRRGRFRRPTIEQARAQARTELARFERNLDGWG
ncbi:hypothetical protein SAMN05216223_11323 [Actinacidiphila yanglinensis]|uniref:Uncharacterized protein n=1 Tax=Actinacidiphila yanglinensis TaxID=310779 RepID=A0A1H6DBJ2_9ACTN|nr:hypothetical protein SAMN05216223_11323 [Actinacidiphila yanglinensis]